MFEVIATIDTSSVTLVCSVAPAPKMTVIIASTFVGLSGVAGQNDMVLPLTDTERDAADFNTLL